MNSPDPSSRAPDLVAGAADADEQRLRAEVAQRLADACAHLEKDSFAALVAAIVERKLRWARQEAEALRAMRRPHAD
jgi:hypothetical protein